jgi:hypothetical protein
MPVPTMTTSHSQVKPICAFGVMEAVRRRKARVARPIGSADKGLNSAVCSFHTTTHVKRAYILVLWVPKYSAAAATYYLLPIA